jgi:hypothetical protein
MSRHILITLIIALGLAIPATADSDCRHRAQRSITPVDTAGIQKVVVIARAGSLHVRGSDTRVIRAGGKACASTASRLDDVVLRSERRGSNLVIRVETPRHRGSFIGRTYASLDLEVELPRGFDVEIDDTSGSMDVRDLGRVSIEDGSGSILVRSVESVSIVDGSGSIDVRDVRGDVTIRDGSGGIEVSRVGGTVRIIEDGSGGIVIRDVGGDVIIDEDGSGSIRVTDVRGDLRVGPHGSGGISFDRIGGTISIRD